MDFCRFASFTDPTDIRPLVSSLTGFGVTPANVPILGLDTTAVAVQIVELAADFFGDVLNRAPNQKSRFAVPSNFATQPKPFVTREALDAADKIPGAESDQ
jgi:hypothetical protein